MQSWRKPISGKNVNITSSLILSWYFFNRFAGTDSDLKRKPDNAYNSRVGSFIYPQLFDPMHQYDSDVLLAGTASVRGGDATEGKSPRISLPLDYYPFTYPLTHRNPEAAILPCVFVVG